MKISRRYLSPKKPRPRPYFAGHKSINKEKMRALPKKMFREVQIPTLPCSERQRADERNLNSEGTTFSPFAYSSSRPLTLFSKSQLVVLIEQLATHTSFQDTQRFVKFRGLEALENI
ncbi:hypothetical protein ACFW04_002219 [Cataglyphis niger]